MEVTFVLKENHKVIFDDIVEIRYHDDRVIVIGMYGWSTYEFMTDIVKINIDFGF